jgi:GntR family transcriptional regulator / MocR family aminotransferase
LDLHISLEGRGGISIQVYRQIRDAVLAGRLRPGDALPSSRELARRLEVSRNTVLGAYEQLHAEGFLYSRPGAGTFVNQQIRQRRQTDALESPLLPRALWNDIPEMPGMAAVTAEYDFRPGIPDTSSFPFAAWRAHWTRQFTRRAIGSGAHIGAGGHPGLRAAIARHVSLSRAVRAGPQDVFVTNGSQQAIELIVRVLLEPGDSVAVEDPGYPLSRGAFRAHGCRVAGVPVDEQGMVVDGIPAGVRLAYVTPSHQYPLGVPMSMARRQALLAWAERENGIVIEDDYDSEFRYGGRPMESLHGLDESGRVLYVGSFSKVMLPTLRLGFAVIPGPLHATFRKAKQLSDWHTAVPLQAALAQFIEAGQLALHIRRMRRVYAGRHERIMRILARDFSGMLTPVQSHCGLHLTALLSEQQGPTDVPIVERARAMGVAVLPLSTHFVDTPSRPGLMLGYGAIPEERIAAGLQKLRQLVRSGTA